MSNLDNLNTRKLVITALAITLVTLVTITVQIPNSVGGYINLGDSMIFALALVGGPALAAIAGSLGSALADILSGYAIWALPSFLIKGLEGLVAGFFVHGLSKSGRRPLLSFSILLILAFSGLLMVSGYFVTSYFLYGYPAAMAAIPGDLIQAASNIPIGLALAAMLYRAGGDKLLR